MKKLIFALVFVLSAASFAGYSGGGGTVSEADLTLKANATGDNLSTNFYSNAGLVADNDSRLTDSRDPNAHTQDWSTVTGMPTTVSGYGITDALTAETDPAFTNWLGTTPPLYEQNFDYGAITNPPSLGTMAAEAASDYVPTTNIVNTLSGDEADKAVTPQAVNAGLTGKVDGSGGSATNLTMYGFVTKVYDSVTNVMYFTNGVAGLTTNWAKVEKDYLPTGTTNTYYSHYQ